MTKTGILCIPVIFTQTIKLLILMLALYIYGTHTAPYLHKYEHSGLNSHLWFHNVRNCKYDADIIVSKTIVVERKNHNSLWCTRRKSASRKIGFKPFSIIWAYSAHQTSNATKNTKKQQMQHACIEIITLWISCLHTVYQNDIASILGISILLILTVNI